MNNRQSGRRRGRNNNSNNNRSQSGGRGGVDQANRIDSRARGNAVQMIEKYKNLARDAQLSGDRVQTEYYLQFADHYFRVHSDFRARQEEKAAQNGQERSHDRSREVRGVEDFDGHDDSDLDTESETERSDERDSRQQGGRDRRDEDDNRGNRQQQGRGRRDREQDRAERDESRDTESGDAEEAAEAAPAPRANRRGPRRARPQDEGEGDAGIDTAVLPPAIGRSAEAAEPEGDDAAPAPKVRRPRRTLATRGAGVEAAE